MQRLRLYQRAPERGGTDAGKRRTRGWYRKDYQITLLMVRTARLLITTLCAWLFSAGYVLANPVQAQHVKVELLAENSGVAPGEPLWMLLRFTPDKPWHISWKNPGDSGSPPTLNWQLPVGWEARAAHFPTPSLIARGEQISYGYPSDTGLLVELVPPYLIQEKQVDIALEVAWSVCADTCVTEQGQFKLTLPVDRFAAVDLRYKKLFGQTRFKLPLVLNGAGTYQIEGDKILIDLPARTLPRKVAAVFIAPANVAQPAAIPAFTYEAKRLQFRLNRHKAFTVAPPQIEVLLELAGQGWSVPAKLKTQN